ncbi:hypothetical protein JB92DRAFT_707690 [Gautieria morchelliformis]|nr:hypothetical protein JB92DRAFT_707690 [Gautieria morchelliformis]
MTLHKIMPSFSTILALMREKLMKREKNGSKERKTLQHRNSCAMPSSSTKYMLPGELIHQVVDHSTRPMSSSSTKYMLPGELIHQVIDHSTRPMSSSSTNYMLPRELIDQVMDHLHDDSPSLRACCITCRAWAPSARFHIFHDIIVLSAKRANALAAILETSPHISPLVRSLTIDGAHAAEHLYPGPLDAAIQAIAPKLTRLKTLQVKRVNLTLQHPKVLSALIRNFPTLQELCILAVTFNTSRDLAALIVAHPFLECLDIKLIYWKSVTAESHCENVFQEYADLHSRLRCISLIHVDLVLIDWMLSYYHVLPVHTVTKTTGMADCDIPQTARLLQLIGASLEHLTLSIYQYRFYCPEKTKIDLLSSNTGLRTLTFHSPQTFYPYELMYRWLPVLLSQVTSCHIEEISIVFRCENHVHLIEELDLKLVQDIITKPVFSGLKRVIFQWTGAMDPVEASQAIRARMNQLDTMGLLVFRHE